MLSRNSLQTVTSLKYALLLAVAWTTAVAASMVWNYYSLHEGVIELGSEAARSQVAEDLIYIQWNDSTADLTNSDTTHQSYRVHRVFAPAAMAEETRSHLTSKNPIHPENEPDSWESAALELFAQGAREYSTKIMVNNEPHLRYMQPLVMKESCFSCHSGQGYTAGRIGGGISVEIPLGKFTAAASARLKPLMVAHLLLWLFGMTMLSIGAWHSGRRERLRLKTLLSLKESEERLDLAIKGTGAGLWDWRIQTGELVINERWAEILGYSLEELQPISIATWFNLCHPDDLIQSEVLIHRHFSGVTEHYECDVRMKHRSGDWVWISDRGRVVERGTEGKPLRMTGTHVDITESKKSRQALHESESRLKDIIFNMADWVWEVDENGVFTYCSDRSVEMMGYAPSELIGRSPFEFMPPEEGARVSAAFSTLVAKRAPIVNLENWVLSKSGASMCMVTNGVPILDALGNLKGYRGVDKDITERKIAEIKLRESEANFRTFFESVGDLLIVANEEGKIIFTNSAVGTVLGYSVSELSAMHIVDLHPIDVRQEAVDIIGAMVRGERASCPLPLMRKNGTLLPVETRIWSGKWNGETCMFGLSKDLSAEQEAQQRFERLFRSNPALMAVSDTKEQRFIDVNEAFLKTIGYTRGEVIGRNSIELNLFADPDQQDLASRQLRETGRIAEIELRIRRKNGEFLHGLFSGELITSHGKQYFLTVMVDITEHRKATKALEESRELLNTVLNSIPARVFWKDPNGIYLGCNELFALDAGLRSPEEIVGKDDRAMVWRDQAELYCADDRAVIESGVAKLMIEEPQTTPTGQLIHLLTSKTPLCNGTGEIVGVLGTYLDITDRKRVEHALKVRESYLSSIIENQPGLVWLKDTESRFLAVNKSFAVSCGKAEPQDLVGLTDLDIWPKELAEQYRRDDVEVIRTGQSKNVQELVRVCGEDRWFETFKTPVLDDNGRIIGTTGYARDITEKKQAEEALRKSEERYHQLFNSVLEGIVTVDPNNVIEYYNPSFAQVFESVQTDELIGRNLLDLTPVDQHDMINAQTQDRKMGLQSQYELDIITLNGRRKNLLASVSPRMDDQGNYLGAFGTVIDITEMKRLQQLESRAQRLETAGQIAGQVAHDFNNMLAPMMAYPELIKDSLSDNDPAFHYLESIEDSARKIADLNQQLLTLSRRGHYNQEVLCLNTVVQQVIRDMGDIPSTLALELCLAPDIMNISGGTAQLYRVVMNLVTNARDAMHDIGLLSIRTENFYADDSTIQFGRVPRGEYIRLSVTDTGCGIPDDQVERVFDPYFTTKSADKKRGSGLGLSVVDAVVKDHSGYIDLTTRVGHGSTFSLYFPIVRGAVPDSSTDKAVGGTERILVIDDDDIQRDVSSRLLTSLGYTVTACANGDAAVKLLEHQQFDLLLLDMIMPNSMDGTDTYRHALEIRPEQKAIIVSGFSESERVLEAQRLGAGQFVRKPLDRRTIAIAVRRELDRIPAKANHR